MAMSGGPASGATLFTSAAHSARVTVGTTANLTLLGSYTVTSSGASLLACTSSTLGVAVDQYTDAVVSATAISGTWTGCNFVPTRTASTAPACMVLERAGTVVGPLITNGRLDATYCFDGAAAA